jgi:hypothetical protein
MRRAPALGLACVIDRPDYNHRYKEKYADERWSLCKTAFTIAVERASDIACGSLPNDATNLRMQF